MDFRYKPGMRTIKTAIAVFLCLLIGYIFHRDSMFYVAIAAVICMQPTYDKSKNVGVNRLIGSLVGGIFGYLSLQLLLIINRRVDWLFVLVNALGILLIIYICNVLRLKEAVTIACIVFLNVVTHFDRDTNDAFFYVLFRMIDTTIGILLAVFINRIGFIKKAEIRENLGENAESKDIAED